MMWCLLLFAVIVECVSIQSSNLLVVLDNNMNDLNVVDLQSMSSFNAHGSSAPYWRATLSTTLTSKSIDSYDSGSSRSVVVSNSQQLVVQYNSSDCTILIHFAVSSSSETIEMWSEFYSVSYKLWQFGFALPLGGWRDDRLLTSQGWGVVQSAFASLAPQSLQTYQYPSSQSTMQLFSLLTANGTRALYFAAHDPDGNTKSFSYAVTNPVTCEFITSRCSGVWRIDVPATVQHAWKMSFPVALRSFAVAGGGGGGGGGVDLWWFEAAQLYRSFVVDTPAVWTQQRISLAPMAAGLPLIFNTGWSVYDVLNVTQGDPNVVVDDVRALRKLFPDVAMALHWYVWNDVKNFDLDYPHYWPAKQGFSTAVQLIETTFDVRVVPYINGRLYDQTLSDFDSAKGYMVTVAENEGIDNGRLVLHNESYGNSEPFAAACPTTLFWQYVIPNVVYELSMQGVSGVYIDQIAAAVPLACRNTSHSHSNGGGNFFSQANRQLLLHARKFQSPIFTENNAETYIGAADVFLSVANYLVLTGGTYVPVFPTVYSDFAMTCGRIFDPLDFLMPNAFSAKLTDMFHYGSILGWLSLRGNLGVLNYLTSSSHAIDVNQINTLSALRQRFANVFAQGQRLMPLLIDNAKALPSILTPEGSFPSISASVWGLNQTANVFLLNAYDKSLRSSFVFDVADYAQILPPNVRLVARQRFVNGSGSVFATFVGAVNVSSIVVAPRDYFYLTIAVK